MKKQILIILLLIALEANAQRSSHTQFFGNESGAPGNYYPVLHQTIRIDNLDIFYREAGDPQKPVILLLHGYPSSSHMYRHLMAHLADAYHVIAPDYPGYGQSSAPSPSEFAYTFDNLATVMLRFIDALGLKKYSLYMQDYGGPVGFRIATQRPQSIQALIVQNANAYKEGLGDAIKPMSDYFNNPNPETERKARWIISEESTKWQYLHGAEDSIKISPDAYLIDQFLLDRPGNDLIQLSLFRDYRNNLSLYDSWQQYFRKNQPPTLVISGKNDLIFLADGARAFKRDIKDAEISLLNGGHFVLEEKHWEAAGLIRSFLERKGIR
jgi:pimeloyl-ACP methyl ester carboxylesterase